MAEGMGRDQRCWESLWAWGDMGGTRVVMGVGIGGTVGCPWVWRETDSVGVSTGMGKGKVYWGACGLEERFGVTTSIEGYQGACVCKEMEGAGVPLGGGP